MRGALRGPTAGSDPDAASFPAVLSDRSAAFAESKSHAHGKRVTLHLLLIVILVFVRIPRLEPLQGNIRLPTPQGQFKLLQLLQLFQLGCARKLEAEAWEEAEGEAARWGRGVVVVRQRSSESDSSADVRLFILDRFIRALMWQSQDEDGSAKRRATRSARQRRTLVYAIAGTVALIVLALVLAVWYYEVHGSTSASDSSASSTGATSADAATSDTGVPCRYYAWEV